MFKLRTASTFAWTVSFEEPENGKRATKTIEVVYNRIPVSDFQQAMRTVQEATAELRDAALVDLVKRLVADFKDVDFTDANGQAIKDSGVIIDAMRVAHHNIILAIFQGYLDAVGIGADREDLRKN